jgi:hypothetical protein
MANIVTMELMQKALPSRKNAITEEVVELINASQNEPEFQGESLLQSLTTYESVMTKHKASISDYVNAVRFCAYMISLDDNYTEAYKKTFIHREFVQQRMSLDTTTVGYAELTSAASRYRRSKLVVDILTLSQIPLDMMFTGARYKAIGILATLMQTAKQDRDKINAAKELLAATKGPENMKIELGIGLGSEAMSMQEKLNEQLAQLAINQKRLLEGGYDIRDVQKTGISLNVMEGDYSEA